MEQLQPFCYRMKLKNETSSRKGKGAERWREVSSLSPEALGTSHHKSQYIFFFLLKVDYNLDFLTLATKSLLTNASVV